MNYSVVIRDRQWKSPGDIPVKMKFLLPNGKELKSFRKSLNEEGSVEGNIDIANSAITGSYTLEVYTSNDILLGSKNFSIEEFVPDRIKVTSKTDKTFLKPGESKTITFTLTAKDLKFYDINMKYTNEAGQYKLFIGTNSQDVKEADFKLEL